MFGLLDSDVNYIRKAMQEAEEVEQALIFGSRAMENYNKGSDVDIAVVGKSISSKTLFHLNELLNEEYPLPYFFDIIYYDDLTNETLKKHIDQVGKEVYRHGVE